MKKVFPLILTPLLLSLLFTACSDSGTTNTDENTAVTGSTEVEAEVTEETEAFTAVSTLEITDFGGRDYRMISTNQDSRHVDICAEELTGATLNDLVFMRNTKVADLYNVNMSATDLGYDQINNLVKNDATSGDMSYELYLTNYTANPLGSGGYLYDFNGLPHIDLSQEWWDQNEIADMTIAGKLFLAIGDISPTELLTSECILFNKVLFENDGMTYPYEDALEGTWTLDKLFTLADGKTRDLNGDGKINVDDDLFSITCWSDYPYAMLYGAGGDFSHVDADGQAVLDIDIEKCANIYNKIYKCLIDTEANYETAVHERSFKVFNDGRAYFCGITFQKIETFLREMEDDYGVLPNPKYDEIQERYSTCVSGAGSMVVVPVSCSDPDYIGAMLEAMACTSYDMITPDLINTMASVKNVRDKESSDVVQMVIRNRNFDTARMHDVAVDGFAASLLQSKSTDVASYFAKNEKLWNKTIAKVNDNYAKLGN